MKRLMKILLGLSIGAALALLFAPKSGRKLREQLIGGATGKLLPAAPIEFPEPESERIWDAGAATAVEEPPVAEPAIVAEVVATEPEVAGDATSEDLRVRIEETRAAVESDIAHPFAPVVVEEPVVEDPVVEVVEEPSVEEPVAEEPVAEEHVAEAAEEPVAEVVEEPVAEVVEEPVAEVVEEPVFEEQVAEEPVVEEPVAEEPVVEEPVVEEPVAEEPVVEEPVAEVVEEPVAEEPVVEEPVAEVVEEPVVEEPVVEEPVVAEPAAREGEPIDQAEMRRRIEETRARLKAKAFDAMMSGESALLSRDSGDKPVPKGDEVKLDGELESTIDESLSQEEY